MTIKNIIFDLGGVLIDINFQKTANAFQQLGAKDFHKVFWHDKQDTIFDDFEIGKISASTFREGVKKHFHLQITDAAFDHAWNAMVLAVPMKNLDFIKSLKTKYKIFLFSNTNEIHLAEIYQMCQRDNGFNHFTDFFERQYYSHLLGMRKPNPEAFKTILKENNLIANETLFIDDSPQHIVGARTAGLEGIHLSKERSLFTVYKF